LWADNGGLRPLRPPSRFVPPVEFVTVHRDLALPQGSLFVFLLRGSAARVPRVLAQVHLRTAFGTRAQLHLPSAMGESEKRLVPIEIIHEADAFAAEPDVIS
jgi:hypothetical protein